MIMSLVRGCPNIAEGIRALKACPERSEGRRLGEDARPDGCDYSPDFLTWRFTEGTSGTGFGTVGIADPLSPVEVEGATGSSCPARGE